LVLVAAKASSTSPTSCAKPAFLCGLSAILIEFADRLIITQLGIQLATRIAMDRAGSSQEEFSVQWGTLGEQR
jgi:hypothetical protein